MMINSSSTVNLSGFYDYPPEIRRVIYTINAVESVQSELRKGTKKDGAFLTQESLRKVLYLALMRLSERWTMPIRDWPSAPYHLSLVFQGRLPI